MTNRSEVKITAQCEHDERHELTIRLPLEVNVVDMSDQDETLWAVWLTAKQSNGKPWFLTTIGNAIPCDVETEFLASALDSYLETNEGQERAVELVKHSLGGEE